LAADGLALVLALVDGDGGGVCIDSGAPAATGPGNDTVAGPAAGVPVNTSVPKPSAAPVSVPSGA
jgi:hypothetical protein